MGGLLLIAVALPIVWRNDYVIDVAITALIWMVLNQSWNLQLGIGRLELRPARDLRYRRVRGGAREHPHWHAAGRGA